MAHPIPRTVLVDGGSEVPWPLGPNSCFLIPQFAILDTAFQHEQYPLPIASNFW